jgi:calcyphosin
VDLAFNILDRDGSGILELADFALCYNASQHPDVLNGKKTEEQILADFVEVFEVGGEKDGNVLFNHNN